jgi:hypothetical protein
VLVVELPGRMLEGVEPADAFVAGYVLADEMALPAVEPELPTDFYPTETVAAGGATPADLAAAGEAGAESSNPEISRQAQLLAAYAAAAAAGNQAGDLRGMVQDLLATCRENGYR